MRKANVLLAIVGILGILTTLGGVANAATLSWTPPTHYTDNTAIAPAEKAAAIYTPAWATSDLGPTGNWTDLANTAPGATSATVPNPSPGQTRFYSVKVTINGATSPYAVPAWYTLPFPVPGAPSNLTISP